MAGIKPSGSSLAYSVTKAALIHLSRALAVIAAPNVRVNSISPGLILTEWGMQFPEERRNAAREATKLKRLPSIEVSFLLLSMGKFTDDNQDCAAAVRMLAVSKSITGQNLLVDSGTSQ